MVCSPLGSSVHGISQARILEWVAMSFSRGSSWPRDWTQNSCITGGFFAQVWNRYKSVYGFQQSLWHGYGKDILPNILTDEIEGYQLVKVEKMWEKLNSRWTLTNVLVVSRREGPNSNHNSINYLNERIKHVPVLSAVDIALILRVLTILKRV